MTHALQAAISALETAQLWQEYASEEEREEVRAALSACRAALEAQPVAWRVRGYNQFKTGTPLPWRYFDGAQRPKVNDPDCCDIEPLFAAPAAADGDARDAARYRWLRNCGEHFTYDGPAKESPWTVIGINHTDCHPCSREELDTAVDAAMSKE